jgi:hypothetical protein
LGNGEAVEEDVADDISLEGLLGAVSISSRVRAPLIGDAGAHEDGGLGTASTWWLGGSMERPKQSGVKMGSAGGEEKSWETSQAE